MEEQNISLDDSSDTYNENSTQTEDLYNLSRKIFVGNISYRVKQNQLTKHFSRLFGPVEYCYIVKDHIRKWSRGIAFVTFKTRESAVKALEATDKQLVIDSRQMRVAPAEESKRTTCIRGEWSNVEVMPRSRGEEGSVHNEQVEQLWEDLDDISVSDCKDCDINRLYDDILIHIFSVLSFRDRMKIERVCRRWQIVAKRSWNNCSRLNFHDMFQGFGRALTNQILSSVLKRCGPYLKCLDLSLTPIRLTDMAADIIGENCPNLLDLNMTKVDLTDVSLRNIAQKCKQLKNINIHSCFHTGDKGINWLFQGCTNLEKADLGNNKNMQGDCFHSASGTLKILTLEDCSKLADFGIRKIGLRCKHLQELDLSRCCSLTDKALQHIAQNLKVLKSLYLCGKFPNMTETGLQQLGRLHKLQSLKLTGNSIVDDSVLDACTAGCPNLQVLDISECHRNLTETGIQTLQRCKHLRDLDVSYIPQVTDAMLYMVAVHGNLRRLSGRACSGITNEGILSMSDLCLDLELVDLCGCYNITNRVLEHFVTLHRGKDRKHLTLKLGGTSVEDTSVDLSECNIELNMFDLSHGGYRTATLMLPAPLSSSSEDEEDDLEKGEMPKIRMSVGMAAGAEVLSDEEWDFNEEHYYDEEDFLYGDDPLTLECWDLS